MYTAAAIFGAVLSTLVLPLPEELALLGAGWVAHGGGVPLWLAWLAAWAGVILGDTATYFLGRGFLPRLLRSRLGRRMVSPPLRRWSEELVQRHGVRAILLGRFLVGLRGPVYLAIGGAKYPALRFTVVNGAIGLVEVALLVGLGYLFGHSHKLAHEVKWIELAVGATLAVLLIAPLFFKRRLERRAQPA